MKKYWGPRLRLILPVVLTSLGIAGLIGCVYIPVFGGRPRTPDGQPVHDLLGDAKSGKPVRPGVTLEDVQRVLGPPVTRTKSGRTFGYHYTVLVGRWFGLCFSDRQSVEGMYLPSTYNKSYGLFLHFDEAGRLKSYDFREDNVASFDYDWLRATERVGDADPFPWSSPASRDSTETAPTSHTVTRPIGSK